MHKNNEREREYQDQETKREDLGKRKDREESRDEMKAEAVQHKKPRHTGKGNLQTWSHSKFG